MVETERTQEAAGSSTPCGPGVWLVGSQGPARAARLGEIMRSIDVEGARTFATDCERPFPLAFEPAKDLLLQLVLVIEQEAPYLLVEFGPELLALLPELGKRSYLREVPGLNLIALGGTKRRLHKDSEQLFRLVYAFASLVLEAKINCPSLAHRPLAIVLDNFDAADRLTVSCIFHLWQRLGNAEVRIVIAAPDPAGPEGERPWLWADDHRTGLSAQAAGLTDAYAEHNVLLRQVLESLHPAATRLDVLGAPGSAREAEGDTDAAELGRRLRTLSLAGQTRVQLRCLGAEDELARQMVGEVSPADLAVGDALLTMGGRDDTVPPLTPGSPRLARRLLRDTIAPETRRRLHAAIAERLARHKGRGEGALVPLAYHLLRGDNRPAGLDYALQAASAGLGFSLNYESILFCCRELLRHTEGVPTSLARAQEVAAWQLTGVTQCYLEHTDSALGALRAAYDRSTQAEVRAQTCYYAGLVAAKLGRDPGAGLAWFERGLGEIDGVTTPESWLERGWLHNGLALLAWQDHRAGEAEALVEHALEFMATYDDVQALNLQINLLNNLSVLHEQRDNHGLALRTWQRLAHWAELLDGGTFAKSYLYRESWLYLLVGDLPAARDACARAFAIAEQVRDFFHMDLLSRACGYLACRLRRFDEALYWYEYYQLLSAKLDDHWRLPEAWAALGHAAVQAGEFVRARDAFRAGVEAAEAVGRGELAEQLRRAVDVLVDPGRVDGLDADGEFCGFRLERPKAKLTTPFALAHLSSATAFAPATHRGLRGATHDSSR